MRKLAIQSITDIITNSSSEIFIINDPKDTKMSLDSYAGFIYDIQQYCNMFLDSQHKEDSYLYSDSWEDCFDVDIASSKYYDESYDYGYNYGDLLVESQGDNSIPWQVMDFIEESARKHGYRIERHHLG